MSDPRPRTLVQDFVALAGALVVLTSLTVAAFVIVAQARHSRADVESHGDHVAAILAHNADYALYTSDPASLQSLVGSIRADQSILYVAVRDRDGRVLASEVRHPGVRIPSPPSGGRTVSRPPRATAIDAATAGEAALEFVVPVVAEAPALGTSPSAEAEVLGFVQLGVGTATVGARLREFAVAVSVITLLLTGLGVGVATVLARRIARPLDALRSVVREIGAGRLDQQVPAGGTAETQELAEAFGSMLGRLGESRDELERRAAELQASNAELAREVAERRDAEQRLRRSALIVANLTEAVALLDHDGRVVDWNPAAARLFGQGGQDGQARAAAGLLASESRPTLVDGIAEAARQGRWEGALEVQGPKGPVPCEAAVIALGSEWGAEFVLVLRDVSERAQLEAQLRQAQKMEAVGRLAGGVAHDFNNLLTLIIGYSDLLLLRDMEDGPRSYVGTIRDAAERAASVTSQLLAFSRRQVMVYKVLDLSAVVSNVEGLLRRMIGEQVQVVTRRGAALWKVRADPTQVEQVLMNLAVNARDAMGDGGTLTIGVENVVLADDFVERNPGSRPGPHVCLSVADTGTGMTPEVQSQIFEPFFTTKEPGKGTGLGLATVYGIVKQSGGYVAAESVLGQGTVFRVFLPRYGARDEVAAERDRTRDVVPDGSEVVLLVEDDDAVRALALTILSARGYTVLEARHAGEALVMAEKHTGPLHLLLTDVVMPHMSGAELARRTSLLRPDTRVLLCSGYTDDEAALEGIRDAGFAFLGKPFSPDALARKVREVLDGPAAG